MALYVPIVLPLLYGIAVLAVAEGNARYHAIFLPLLCVMAGGAIARGIPAESPDRIVRTNDSKLPAWFPSVDVPSIAAATAWAGVVILACVVLISPTWEWDHARFALPPILIVCVVAVPILSGVMAMLRRSWAGWISTMYAPSRRVWVTSAASVLIIVLASFAVARTGVDLRSDVAAVSPGGWHRTVISEGEETAAPVVLEHSGTAPQFRQVSFPDAALLQFDTAPKQGDRVELARRLDDLEPGETYVFYLQVYDPGIGGDGTERLLITLNDIVVWERASGRMVLPRWHYVRVEWQADGEALDIAVSREAGTSYRETYDAIPKIRTLHLYPRY